MQETMQTIQQALDVLLDEGWTLFRGTIQGQEGAPTFSFMHRHMPYQAWYTKALRFIRQLYPERSDDFQAHYRELLALQRSTPSPHGIAKPCGSCSDALPGARRIPQTLGARGTLAPGLGHQRQDGRPVWG
jgi:hypothetical protein